MLDQYIMYYDIYTPPTSELGGGHVPKGMEGGGGERERERERERTIPPPDHYHHALAFYADSC
jgi:hypothetical protein